MSVQREIKPVIVSGGGSGIGFEAAKVLLQTGKYHVILLGKIQSTPHMGMEEARKALIPFIPQTAGRKSSDYLSAFECDLGNSKAISETLDKIISIHPSLYGLVNNAGIYPFGGVENTTEDSWDETFAVNLKSAFLLTQKALPALKKSVLDGRGGRIVNLSSTAGILPNHFALAYSVSKAALIQFTKTIAKELGKDGITVNCICPGIVRSPMHKAYHRTERDLESFYAKRGAAFPLGRVGEPEDIANAIEFFLSEKASWVTGDVFIIDGGRLLL